MFLKGAQFIVGSCFLGWHHRSCEGIPASSGEVGQSQTWQRCPPSPGPQRERTLRGSGVSPAPPLARAGPVPCGAGARPCAAAPPFSWAPACLLLSEPPPPEWAFVCPGLARQGPEEMLDRDDPPVPPDQFRWALSHSSCDLASEVPVLILIPTGTRNAHCSWAWTFAKAFL